MFMDMDFPHPRKAAKAADRQASYASLVASATARQATSMTVSAMLSNRHAMPTATDFAGSRIRFFAGRAAGLRGANAGGAFWSHDEANDLGLGSKVELPVNLDGSTKGNAEARETETPELQDAKWGTEL